MLQFGLSFLELDLIGEALDVDVHQTPLSVPHHGRYVEERDAWRERAESELAGRGLVVDDRLVPYVERAAVLLARGEPSVSVDGTGPWGPIRARAAIGESEAVLAVEAVDGGILFTLGDPGDVVSWVLGLLPQHERARGASVTVPVSDADEHGRAVDEDFSQFSYTVGAETPPGRAGRDAGAAEHLFSRPELGAGRLLVETRGRLGRDGMCLTIDWIDKDMGRYIGYSKSGTDGTRWRVYEPGDYALFVRTLRELIGTCAGELARAVR